MHRVECARYVSLRALDRTGFREHSVNLSLGMQVYSKRVNKHVWLIEREIDGRRTTENRSCQHKMKNEAYKKKQNSVIAQKDKQWDDSVGRTCRSRPCNIAFRVNNSVNHIIPQMATRCLPRVLTMCVFVLYVGVGLKCSRWFHINILFYPNVQWHAKVFEYYDFLERHLKTTRRRTPLRLFVASTVTRTIVKQLWTGFRICILDERFWKLHSFRICR